MTKFFYFSPQPSFISRYCACRPMSSEATNSASCPSSACWLRKSGKKKSLSTAKMMMSFSMMIAQSVRPSVMLRKPS